MQSKKLPKDPHRWVMLLGNVFVWAEFGPPVPVSLPRHFEKVRGLGIKNWLKSQIVMFTVGLLASVPVSSPHRSAKKD
jgi:hypothetical protein